MYLNEYSIEFENDGKSKKIWFYGLTNLFDLSLSELKIYLLFVFQKRDKETCYDKCLAYRHTTFKLMECVLE